MARLLSVTPWVTDGITSTESYRLEGVYEISFTRPEFANYLLSYWLRHGVSGELFHHVHAIAPTDEPLAIKLMNLPWILDGISQIESNVLVSLTGIPPTDAEKVDRILSQPWVADGVTIPEAQGAQFLSDIWGSNREMAEFLLGLAWVADGIAGEEPSVLRSISETASTTPGFAEHLLAHWMVRGFSRSLFWYVKAIAASDEQLAKEVMELPWVVDGFTQSETDLFNTITGRRPVDADMARQVLGLWWLEDGATEVESEAAQHLVDTLRSDRELGQFLLDLPWIADGISENEVHALWGISGTSYGDVPLAWLIIEKMGNLFTLSGDLSANALAALGQLGEFPEDLWLATRQPWFEDGLDIEEAAFITALMPLAYESPSTYADLLESRFTLHREISLPFKGTARLWAFQNVPFPPQDDILTVLENAAVAAEEFTGAPFPTEDIIVLFVVPDEETGDIGIAFHKRTHILVANLGGGLYKNNPNVLRHELAHYYFGPSFGPHWLREGAAGYFESYMRDRSGTQTLADRREVMTGSDLCHSVGINNIAKLNQLYDRELETPGCAYILGENFLHEAREVMGEDRLSAALREIYYLGVDRETTMPGSEEEIYEVFLRNTPSGRQEDFQSLYKRLHSG